MKQYDIVKTSQYKRDCKRARKQGLDMEKLELVIAVLRADGQLPPRNRDHALAGEWAGKRECHVDPDWLLIYEKQQSVLSLILIRTGSHSELGL